MDCIQPRDSPMGMDGQDGPCTWLQPILESAGVLADLLTKVLPVASPVLELQSWQSDIVRSLASPRAREPREPEERCMASSDPAWEVRQRHFHCIPWVTFQGKGQRPHFPIRRVSESFQIPFNICHSPQHVCWLAGRLPSYPPTYSGPQVPKPFLLSPFSCTALTPAYPRAGRAQQPGGRRITGSLPTAPASTCLLPAGVKCWGRSRAGYLATWLSTWL